MSVSMLPMAGRTAGPIKIKLGIGTHVDPGSVLVKVKIKVIYLCVQYNRIHDSDTWRTTMNRARNSSSRCHLVNANKTIPSPDRGPQGRENSLIPPDDGYFELVFHKMSSCHHI